MYLYPECSGRVIQCVIFIVSLISLQEYTSTIEGIEVLIVKPAVSNDAELRPGIVHYHGGGWVLMSPGKQGRCSINLFAWIFLRNFQHYLSYITATVHLLLAFLGKLTRTREGHVHCRRELNQDRCELGSVP